METTNVHTFQQVMQSAVHYLEKHHKNTYAAERLLTDRLNWHKTDLLRHFSDIIPQETYLQYLKDLNEFIEGKPLQYIVGKEWFYGRPFKVTADTLIPRPETEELVHHALQFLDPEKPLKILDIGTGSGVIAVTVKKERPLYEVTATDICAAALKIARQNAAFYEADIRFLQGNLLEPVQLETFDCVISNPPYIGYDEIALMDESVLSYEPHTALFAENSGLSMYEKMAYELPFFLNSEGSLFMEIGFQQGGRLKELYQKAFPGKDVQIEKDLAGQDRMLIVK